MAEGGMSLDQLFIIFSKFDDPKSDGRTISLIQLDKWFKQANVIGKYVTPTDTGVAFNKFRSRAINYAEFQKMIDDLATQKKISSADIKDLLENCGLPGTGGAPAPSTNLKTV